VISAEFESSKVNGAYKRLFFYITEHIA